MAPEITHLKQNQSEIAKKWWNSKHVNGNSLKAERDYLLIEAETLKQERSIGS
jgi:hypothetical protein